MLQTFILIDDFSAERKKAVTNTQTVPPTSADVSGRHMLPEPKLKHLGFRLHPHKHDSPAEGNVHLADAVILAVLPEEIASWRSRLTAIKPLPLIWWCDEFTFPGSNCTLDMEIDGMLSPGMNASEIHCTMLLSFNRHIQRRDWHMEREQLLSRLEERKWVEQAKRILCEIKGITEADAYDFLRKQAMNERKRIVDVSTSIVKVYQLLQDQNKGGRTR
ncbi:hypothetical protein SY83_19560 [Paenibacillus swuensis]|uniref:ANTAR domain-containing protein n=1 Tax=Paenibacillus swuensis TaxID=1178515 RepID=A0A172TM18_9BACL|nr:ANTAR domain-containing protein [Paenibacillus swuensis]ANE48119.1 hypothetical protein SY83_19560 [Paenibacillus swuensis]